MLIKPGYSDCSEPARAATLLQPRVGIVVLNWNGSQVLEDCLRSIGGLRYPNYETIVVDNGSTDGSADMVRAKFPTVVLIEIDRNLGFSAGNNRGIRVALQRGNDYVFVLNNDTIVAADCIQLLVEAAESGADIGAVAPKIFFWNPKDRLWFGGGTYSPWKGRNGHVGYGRPEDAGWQQRRDMEFVSGCAMLVHRRVWERVGGYDELLFRSSEDVDWSLRAQKAGYRLVYEPHAVIWHRESFDIIKNEGHSGQMYFYTRNALAVMWLHGKWYHWLTVVPYQAALTVKRILIALRRRDVRSIASLVRGWKDFPALARKMTQEQKTGAFAATQASCCRKAN